MQVRNSAGWGLGVLLVAGCGAPTVSEYAEQLELAFCQWETSCHRFVTVNDCQSARAMDGDPQLTYMVDAVAAGTAEYDGEAALACFEAIRELGCTDEYPDTPAVCDAVFRGKIGRNGPCRSAHECVGEAICGFDPACADQCCPGACRVLPEPLEKGDACGGSNPCEEGLYCGFDAISGVATVCTARVKVGEDCSLGEACVEDAYCDGERCRAYVDRAIGESCSASTDRCVAPGECHYFNVDGLDQVVCVEPGGLGAPCVPSDPEACARFDTFCDAATLSCELLPAPGAGCSAAGCADHAFCLYTEYEVGTCVALASIGEACGGDGSGNYVECVGDLRCEDGVCALPEEQSAQCPVPGGS